MNEYKEILTKAVTFKCKKSFSNDYEMVTEEVPNTILGCWIINHKFNGNIVNDKVIVNGNFDVNVWYSYDNDRKTSVSTSNFSYEDEIPINNKDSYDNDNEVIVKSLKQPSVVNVSIDNGRVLLHIDKELGIEIVGNTKIRVMYDRLVDDYLDISNTDDEIDNINTNYL